MVSLNPSDLVEFGRLGAILKEADGSFAVMSGGMQPVYDFLIDDFHMGRNTRLASCGRSYRFFGLSISGHCLYADGPSIIPADQVSVKGLLEVFYGFLSAQRPMIALIKGLKHGSDWNYYNHSKSYDSVFIKQAGLAKDVPDGSPLIGNLLCEGVRNSLSTEYLPLFNGRASLTLFTEYCHPKMHLRLTLNDPKNVDPAAVDLLLEDFLRGEYTISKEHLVPFKENR